MLKLLARNAEANRHLFAVGRSPTHAKATAADSADDSSSGGEGDFASEGDASCGGGGGGGVVAVRELDWFTFCREEGPTVAAIRDPAEELSQVGQETSPSGERGMSTYDLSVSYIRQVFRAGSIFFLSQGASSRIWVARC